jgi:hypothetical protein
MFFKKKKLLPHEALPDILFWMKGDELNGSSELISISEDGTIFKKSIATGKLYTENVYRIACIYGRDYDGYNESAVQRRRDHKLSDDGYDYFQYIQDFNKAYREIKFGLDELPEIV